LRVGFGMLARTILILGGEDLRSALKMSGFGARLKIMKYLRFICISVLLMAGCGRKETEKASSSRETESDQAVLMELQTRVNELSRRGQINAAIEELSAALENRIYAPHRRRIFPYLLNVMLAAGKVDRALQSYLDAVENDEELARSGFGVIGSYYEKQGKTPDLTDWMKTLTASKLPDDLAERAFNWLFHAKLKKEPLKNVLLLLPAVLDRFDSEGAARVFFVLKTDLLSANNHKAVEQLLARIEELAGDDRRLSNFVAAGRVGLYARDGKWAEAEQLFMSTADSLEESELRSCFTILADHAADSGQSELVDRISKFVLEKHAAKAGAALEAARRWVQVADESDIHEICRRLKIALDSYVPPRIGFDLYKKRFYNVMENGTDDDREKLLDVGRALEEKLDAGIEKYALQSLLFDGSFLMKDYDRALALLEESMPNRDSAWRAMAVNKLKAHRAMDLGQTDEAVRRFRAFMEYVAATWREPEHDPATDMMHTREMALGFNARRIGDILADAGRSDEAAAAYDEARAYYTEASRRLRPDSREYRAVREVLAALPAPETGETAADE